ncbi:basic amino acid ABC transporter substrate-binding protein [Spirochaeta africana]|uniref:Periplasmic component of amino acid ABC-type transporter/signal transduction system n=1 Tax=Spirochaeta africana (strain ATCC 700263 / DSM 8902 / Z-7692) TaxID=889378 RepID=H9UH20_SPIAZ|nr:basic amino acid ABC transporter substrate-binding protein [Spirochaeta africana]AFG36813.1 periplasmic component of amino acid ABC-type transporter/signal transduction system [Spirochaeta africana DSM 8902]
MIHKLMRAIIAVGMAALLAAAFVSCQAEETGRPERLVIATDATWPPMQYVDENREIVGFDIDLINAIGEAADVEIEVRNTAWDGIFAGLLNRDYDAVISSVTITEDRQRTMDFSTPYLNAGQVLIVRSETEGVSELADLAGQAVGAQIGTTGFFEVQNTAGIEALSYDEIGLAIEDLANGQIAGVVADTPIAANYVLQNENYRDQLMIVGEPFTEEYFGIAVRQGNERVLSVINEGLEAVIAAGLIEELEDKWLR